jgi:hypothetical protein
MRIGQNRGRLTSEFRGLPEYLEYLVPIWNRTVSDR